MDKYGSRYLQKGRVWEQKIELHDVYFPHIFQIYFTIRTCKAQKTSQVKPSKRKYTFTSKYCPSSLSVDFGTHTS